jgi:hypothetical protein
MPKVLNARIVGKTVQNSVYCGRPSEFGNPFVIGKDGNRDEVIRKFETWFRQSPERVERARKLLNDKNLICWCAPLACHCDVLLKIANLEGGGLKGEIDE